MSSYHSSFTYLNKNSADDKSLIIAAFEPDSGAMDTFLSMTAITEDSFDGTKKFDYGAKFDSVATISITVIKQDKTEFSVAENRDLLRWLTGARTNSWLDLYEGNTLKYSFFGRVTNVQQQKLDARIIGLVITFTSIHPWAYSAPQPNHGEIGENSLQMNDDGILYKWDDANSSIGFDNGVLFNDANDTEAAFHIDDLGVVYADDDITIDFLNESDDLYTYINLDMVYTNILGNEKDNTLTIKNVTLDETTAITGISLGETVTLSSGQFIISSQPYKIFGDSFNFVWPRLRPGLNEFVISGSGQATLDFTFRYPIKIGDCAIDLYNITDENACGGNCLVDEDELTAMLEEVLYNEG